MQLFGIWCHDAKNNKGDWLREFRPSHAGQHAIIAYESVRNAQRRAADHYGYDSYSQAKKHGWCEVKPLLAEPLPSNYPEMK